MATQFAQLAKLAKLVQMAQIIFLSSEIKLQGGLKNNAMRTYMPVRGSLKNNNR